MRDDRSDQSSREQAIEPSTAPAPDSNATGSGAPLPSSGGSAPDHEIRGRESQEREAAWRRGRQRRGTEPHDVGATGADPELARIAFSALAENVRDYAIFLLNPDGIISYWGEGAHLMKRWTREEAEGAHLRLLYIDGGSEDGTAEDHLRDAAAHGESVSHGHRVRGDGTTFRAHITLTALRDDDGTLLGFAKVTRDLTAQHVADAAVALAAKATELAEAHGERRNLVAEIDVLKEELSVLRDELQSRGRAADQRDDRSR